MGRTIFNTATKREIRLTDNTMFPLLHRGDVLHVASIAFDKIILDDIVYCPNASIVVGRVIYRTPTSIVIKPDHIAHRYVFIHSDQEIYTLRYAERKGIIVKLLFVYRLQSALYWREIKKVISAFRKSTVDFLVLKGLPLHIYLTGKAPQRLYADCDILISPGCYNSVDRVFKQLGYKTKQKIRATANPPKEVEYYKKVSGFIIVFEVHLEITFATYTSEHPFRSLRKNIQKLSHDFLKRKRIVVINGLRVPVLSSTDLVLYLFLHFFGHHYKGMYRLLFINSALEAQGRSAALLRSVVKQADGYSLLSFIVPGIYLLSKYYRTPSLQRLFRIRFFSNIRYALFWYKLLYRDTRVFESYANAYFDRLRKALLLFFYSQQWTYTVFVMLFSFFRRVFFGSRITR